MRMNEQTSEQTNEREANRTNQLVLFFFHLLSRIQLTISWRIFAFIIIIVLVDLFDFIPISLSLSLFQTSPTTSLLLQLLLKLSLDVALNMAVCVTEARKLEKRGVIFVVSNMQQLVWYP